MPPCLAVADRGPRKGLWGDEGPEGAVVFTDVGPAPGVERPDCEFESGERSELMSIFWPRTA